MAGFTQAILPIKRWVDVTNNALDANLGASGGFPRGILLEPDTDETFGTVSVVMKDGPQVAVVLKLAAYTIHPMEIRMVNTSGTTAAQVWAGY